MQLHKDTGTKENKTKQNSNGVGGGILPYTYFKL